jgi:hypothetical protein
VTAGAPAEATIAVMAEPGKEPTPEEKSEDDQRAQAAAVNRKRTLEDWEDKKKRWRSMGVPPALPAAGSPKAKK